MCVFPKSLTNLFTWRYFLYLENLFDVAQHKDHQEILFVPWQTLVVDNCPGKRPLHCRSVLKLPGEKKHRERNKHIMSKVLLRNLPDSNRNNI